MAKQGICVNIGNCDNANNKKVITVQDGLDFTCPECEKPLVAVAKEQKRVPMVAYLLVAGLLAGLAWYGWNSFTEGSPPVKPDRDSSDLVDGGSEPIIPPYDTTSKANAFLTDFAYLPPVPDAQKSLLKGIVELGATGFNSFIIREDDQRNWKLEKAAYGSSLVYEHMATEDDIVKGLREYIADILKYGVKPKNIHFIASSGASKEENVMKIMDIMRDKLGYRVNTVTPEQEAKFALRCILPEKYEGNAFVVDMGSSNTKISYIENGKEVGFDTFGSKYFQLDHTDTEVRNDILTKFSKVPKNVRSICFIMGGVPFELAKQIRKDKERYNCLMSPNAYVPEGDRQKAGLVIYSAIAQATQCRQFVFDWDANFSIGYLRSIN
ncbi:hypothetical protein [Spirosoma sp. 209]|uniref:hypothetical protein n=1 Tax=Spirosoma sp. 209 TaxID=1955701 RepID=UPI001F1CD128|nr:hypothetical protein [Spirosoma sp. 209]